MLALTGWLALLQALILPGSLAVLLALPRARLWHWLLLAPPLSALANFWLVLALVGAGLYRREVLAAALLAELAALGWLLWRRRPSLAVALAVAAALAALAVGLQLGIVLDGSIFRAEDSVVSWNRWAQEWAAGELPARMLDYPQLLPAVQSLGYVWQGTTDVVLFAKAIGVDFTVMLVGAGVALIAAGQRIAGLASLVLLAGFGAVFSHRLANGTADLPVAALSVAALVTVLLVAADEDRTRAGRLVLLGAAVAAAAALTKQAGMPVALLYPLLAGRVFWRRAAVAVLAVAGPWYALQYGLTVAGAARWRLDTFVAPDVHQGRAPLERPLPALAMLGALLPWPLLVAVAAGLAAALRQRFWQLVTGLYILPYGALWTLLWSYDERNLLPVLAVLALTAGAGYGGLDGVLRASRWPWRVVGPAACVVLLVAAGYGLIGSPLLWPDRRLLAEQRTAQQEIGDPALNRALAAYFADPAARPVLITAYHLAAFVPGLRHLRVEMTYFRDDGRRIRRKLQRLPDAYILQYAPRASPEVSRMLDGLIAAGSYTVVLRTADGSRLLRPQQNR